MASIPSAGPTARTLKASVHPPRAPFFNARMNRAGLSPAVAAVLMSLSTVIVAVNAQLLRREVL